MVRQRGFEPLTPQLRSAGWRTILLSYWRALNKKLLYGF